MLKELTCIFSSVLLLVTIGIPNSSCHPEVKLAQGTIIGRRIQFEKTDLDQYLGIPFAQPPTNELRFQKPVELSEIRDIEAVEWPNSCIQSSMGDAWEWFTRPVNDKIEQSEDCLYINLWTPKSNSTVLKPVMFWIHGGGFASGSASSALYDGRPLSAFGDIVLVTFNYRLGPLGFLYGKRDDAPGNLGMWDMLLALKWVNQNIQHFGGDPQKVTLFSESAGAVATSNLFLSPIANGLYSNIILMSGNSALTKNSGFGKSIFQVMDEFLDTNLNEATNGTCAADESTEHASKKPNHSSSENALLLARLFPHVAGCVENYESDDYISPLTDDTLSCLRKKTPEELSKVLQSAEIMSFRDAAFEFITGDEMHPYEFKYLLEKGVYPGNISIIFGNTNDDGSVTLSGIRPFLTKMYTNGTRDQWSQFLKKSLNHFNPNIEDSFLDELVNYYFDAESDNSAGHVDAFNQFVTDFVFVCPGLKMAKQVMDKNNVYSYHFSFKGKATFQGTYCTQDDGILSCNRAFLPFRNSIRRALQV